MTTNDPLLDQTLQCLSWHRHREWGDRVPLDVFTRLLAKNIRAPGWTPNTHLELQPQELTSRREVWTAAQLARLRRGHESKAGDDFNCPIIVAEYQGTQRLLDGNHRNNRWIETGDERTHDVNIHCVTETAAFVELPAG